MNQLTLRLLTALIALLPAGRLWAELPQAVTPTAAPSLASPGAPARPACRPGVAPLHLASPQAVWAISPCSGGVQAVTLQGPQFRVAARVPPPGMPGWASAKVAEGQLDLVATWDAPWDPFQDVIAQGLVAGAAPITISRREGATVTPQQVPSLAALQKVAPEWHVLSHDAAHVAMVWPDPRRIQSPLYLTKRWTLAARNPDGKEQPLSLHVELAAWNLSGQPLQLALRHQVTTYQGPDGGSGGLLAMFSAPPDNKGAGLWQNAQLLHQDVPGLVKAEAKDLQRAGKPDWLGVDSRYFLLATIPLSGYEAQSQSLLEPRGNGGVQVQLSTGPTPIAPTACVPSWVQTTWGGTPCADATAAGKTWTYQTFAGPKELDALKAVGHELIGSVDFGWFGMIAMPMLAVLRWAHDISGLWSLAILILTLLVKVLLWPVTARSMKSMKKMQQLKPELDKVRADLEARAKKLGQDKADPQELQRATFELYKKHDVNPLGGCLPLLLQMPVYIALYRTINMSVELFNQPLFGWITDLTAKDPYYVLPLVLGGVMFAQQKVTPQAGGDPTQQKMMLYFMPVLFTAMMLQLPSGLTLYILANTLLSVLQTVYVNRAAKAA